jgi:hypothetical protein
VEGRLRRIAQTQRDADYLLSFTGDVTGAARHLVGHRQPLEVLVRLAVVDEPITYADGRHRAGRVDEMSAALGVMVDVDLARPGDDRPYADLDTALGVVEDYGPTAVLQCGPGLPCYWLFTEPADPYLAVELGRDLIHAIGARFAELGYAFDSPQPAVQWLRIPGTWSVRRQCLVEVVTTGGRVDLEELGDLVPHVAEEEHSYSRHYVALDDPWLARMATS